MLLGAFLKYIVRFLIYGAVALCGIFAGIKIRKNKDKKENMKGNQ